MSRFAINPTLLSGLVEVERQVLPDHRGAFSRLFCAEELHAHGFDGPIAQINHSYTRQCGTLRGMHFQHAPFAEIKLVSCIRGRVLDVAVDLRRDSPTFLSWHSIELSAERHNALLIPPGFAHGFQTLEDDCELIYLHSQPYQADAEGGINPLDPRLSIAWPLPISECSERDRNHPPLTTSFSGLAL
ncbi:dTDP-4-dehydrorhamnose 3,5-epimerase family protein [Neisseriaceae bacterium JH1-16]|nr:dTDP-4-dehydrorhamnose 3,5-epimerase family protein [Neisseriaceae bacterium JH1-16]